MSWLFSKRCQQALNDGKIKVSIPSGVRVRIWRAFQDYDAYYEAIDEKHGPYITSTLAGLPQRMEAELGISVLMAYPESGGAAQPSKLEGFVLRGNYPPYVFDAIELFYQELKNDKDRFQSRFNGIMEESGLAWRMANGKVFPIDSVYIAEEISKRAQGLLLEVEFQGALQEFEKARVDLINQDCEGAMHNANLAVESTVKEILGITRAKPGELYHSLIQSKIIPDYYDGFLKSFEDILRCVAVPRNEELGVGHGKGPSRVVVPPELSELVVNLSAVLINYLIKQHLNSPRVDSKVNGEIAEEDLPF